MQLDYRDYVTLGTIGLVLAWDVFLARKGEGNTLSWRWAKWAQLWPVWPLLIGILMGHLFFPNRAYTDCALCAQSQALKTEKGK